MRFHGLMMLRDEADIIEQNLNHLLTWLDGIYILDMGSTDGTWDIVQDFAGRDSRVVPFRHEPLLFSDTMRGYIFANYRDRFETGDWVTRTDADEFYQVHPPQFIKERLRPGDSAVHLQWYYFRLTASDVADYESAKVDILEDRKRPIEQRRRYYKIAKYAEPRMFRYRRTMQWPDNIMCPYNAGFVSRERIPIRHYPHRDPLQMQARFQLRAAMLKLNPNAPRQWKLDDWRNEVIDDRGISAPAKDAKQGLAGAPGHDTGDLLYWKPGTELPDVRLHNHVPKFTTRLAQRIIHPALLPLLDRRRQQFDPNFIPVRLPDDVQAASRVQSSPATGDQK